eukprot:228418-Alexandrium_andersonii.AAC.1
MRNGKQEPARRARRGSRESKELPTRATRGGMGSRARLGAKPRLAGTEERDICPHGIVQQCIPMPIPGRH